jgi:hypothetical protein
MPRFNQHKYGRFLTARGGGRVSYAFLTFVKATYQLWIVTGRYKLLRTVTGSY